MSDHAINLALLISAIVTGGFEAAIFWMILQDYRKARAMPELSPKRWIVLVFLSVGPLLALFVIWLFAASLRSTPESFQDGYPAWRYYGLGLLLIIVAVIGLAIGRFQRKHSALPEAVDGVLAGLPQHTVTATTPVAQSKLIIESANYATWSGHGKRYDVTRFLRNIISGDSLVFGPIDNGRFWIGDENLVPNDPLEGNPKRLEVTYSYDGEQSKTIRRAEHGRITLPEDSVVDWLGKELNKAKAEIDSLKAAQPQLKLSPLQIDALQLSGELLEFLETLGPPPAPKYTAHEFNNMPASQMRALIDAKDGDILEACEYYRPGELAFTRQMLENQITVHWTRLLPWYQKLEAAYMLKGFKEKVET